MEKKNEKKQYYCLKCGGTKIQSLCYVWANSWTQSDEGDSWYEWADYPDVSDYDNNEYWDECIECGHKKVGHGVSKTFLALKAKWDKVDHGE